jgi:hypothetical protein
MKKNKKRDEFLAQLRKVPIVQVACEKVGVSRNSIYRWRNDDEEFRKEMELALDDGEALVNDMSESQLLSLIKEKNWSAISFWLRHRNPKFRDKVEVTAKFTDDGKLSPEQEVIVREALRLASFAPETSVVITEEQHGTEQNDSASPH